MLRIICLLAPMLFGACAVSPSETTGVVDPLNWAEPDCQLHYSTVPSFALTALNQERAAKITRLSNAPPSQQAAFMAGFQSMTLDLVDFLTRETAEAEILPVVGGFEGDVSPSLSLLLNDLGPDANAMATRLAAALGYVFLQQGVLGQCIFSGAADEDASVLILSETEGDDLLSIAAVEDIFRAMIEQAGGPKGVGFTYYPRQDQIVVIVGEHNNVDERTMMAGVLDDLRRSAGDPDVLVLTEARRWSTYAQNIWANNPDGGGHLKTGGFSPKGHGLDPFRAEFLAAIDELPSDKALLTEGAGHRPGTH